MTTTTATLSDTARKDQSGRRIEYYSLSDALNRCRFGLFWMSDYHAGHPCMENETSERGQMYFADPRNYGFPMPEDTGEPITSPQPHLWACPGPGNYEDPQKFMYPPRPPTFCKYPHVACPARHLHPKFTPDTEELCQKDSPSPSTSTAAAQTQLSFGLWD